MEDVHWFIDDGVNASTGDRTDVVVGNHPTHSYRNFHCEHGRQLYI